MNRWLRLKFNNNSSIFTLEPSVEMTSTMKTTEPTQTTGPPVCKDEEDWCHYLSPWECDHQNTGNSCLKSCEKCGNTTRGNLMQIIYVFTDSGKRSIF